MKNLFYAILFAIGAWLSYQYLVHHPQIKTITVVHPQVKIVKDTVYVDNNPTPDPVIQESNEIILDEDGSLDDYTNYDEFLEEPSGPTFTWNHNNIKYGFKLTPIKNHTTGIITQSYRICYYDDQGNKYDALNDNKVNTWLTPLKWIENNKELSIAASTTRLYNINDTMFVLILRKKHSHEKFVSLMQYGPNNTMKNWLGFYLKIPYPDRFEQMEPHLYQSYPDPGIILVLNDYYNKIWYYTFMTAPTIGPFTGAPGVGNDEIIHPNLKY